MVLGWQQDERDIQDKGIWDLMWESGMTEGAKARRLGLLLSLRLDVWHGVDRSGSELAARTTQHVRERASSAVSGITSRRHMVDWLRTIQSNRWHQDVSATEARLTKWGDVSVCSGKCQGTVSEPLALAGSRRQ